MNEDSSVPSADGSPGARQPAAPGEGVGNPGMPPGENGELSRFLKQLNEIVEYFFYHLEAQTDRARLYFRNVVVRYAVNAILLWVAACLVVGGAFYTTRGLAGGLRAWFGDRAWLGELLAGLILLAVVAVGTWLRIAMIRKSSWARTVAKYEQRKLRQQTRFGRNVSDQSAAAGKK